MHLTVHTKSTKSTKLSSLSKIFRATVKPDVMKEEETNYLYNYRVLGRVWRWRQRQTSWRSRKTIGPEDEKYLVTGTPSSQLSLASNELESSPLHLDDEKEVSGTRRSSTSSGIGTGQGDSGAEAGSLTGCQPNFSALPILAPIKSTAEPDKSQTSRIDSERYVDPQKLRRESPNTANVRSSTHTAVVSLPNPQNWNISEERTSGEYRHGKLAPICTNTADTNNRAQNKRKKKRTSSSTESTQFQQNVPLKTITNGKLNSKLKLSPILDVSGESHA